MTKPRLRQATLRLKVTRWLKVQPLKEMHPPHPEAQRGHHLGHGHTGHPRSHSAQSSPRQTSWGVCHTLCLPLSLQLPPHHCCTSLTECPRPPFQARHNKQHPRKPVLEGVARSWGPQRGLSEPQPPTPVLVHSRTILQEGERSGALPARTQITVELL